MITSVGSTRQSYWFRCLVGTVLALVVIGTVVIHVNTMKRKTIQPPRPRGLRLLVSNKYTRFNASSRASRSVELEALEDLKELEGRRIDTGCSCSGNGVKFQYQVLPENALKMRKYVYTKWREREQLVRPRPPLGFCPANSPLQFVSSGIEIEPMQSTRLVGLVMGNSPYFDDDDDKLIFTSSAWPWSTFTDV